MQVSTNGAFGCGLFYPDLHMSEHVSECISAGIASWKMILGLSLKPILHLHHLLLAAPQLLLFSKILRITFTLSQFLSLPHTPVPGSSSINISNLAKSLSNTHRSLNQYLATQKKQSSIGSWPHPRPS